MGIEIYVYNLPYVYWHEYSCLERKYLHLELQHQPYNYTDRKMSTFRDSMSDLLNVMVMLKTNQSAKCCFLALNNLIKQLDLFYIFTQGLLRLLTRNHFRYRWCRYMNSRKSKGFEVSIYFYFIYWENQIVSLSLHFKKYETHVLYKFYTDLFLNVYWIIPLIYSLQFMNSSRP